MDHLSSFLKIASTKEPDVDELLEALAALLGDVDVGGSSSIVIPKASLQVLRSGLVNKMEAAGGGHRSAASRFKVLRAALRMSALRPSGAAGQMRSPQAVGAPVQMIGEDGTFYASNVEQLIGSAEELSSPGAPFAVVSIIGPQSSGKSFLLNRLFGTTFKVMNAAKGRAQTTKGLWLSRCIRPSLLVIDVEGSDGREREEDDASFEKQSALFALTVSDLMMVNMWIHDIGRQQGGSVPLLRTIFEERVKLEAGRTKVLVVIRGCDFETPISNLERDVVKTMQELWESIHSRPGQQTVKFSDYIDVSVAGLPDKVLQQPFEEKVTTLRESFARGGLVGLRQDKVSASGFSFSAEGLWETIQQNKRLDLPAHGVIVANFCCEKIMRESLDMLNSHEDYLSLKENLTLSPLEFNLKLESLLFCILTRYDLETMMYDQNIRTAKRQELENEILHLVESFCRNLVNRLCCQISNECQENVAAQLNLADDPIAEINASVMTGLNMFTETCEGLSLRYQDLCCENRNILERELISYAQALAQSIEEQPAAEEVEEEEEECEEEDEEEECVDEDEEEECLHDTQQENQCREPADEAPAKSGGGAGMLVFQLFTASARLVLFGDPLGFVGL